MLRWKIARVMGINIYVNWSFLLAPLLVVISTWDRDEPVLRQGSALFALCSLLATFGCVIVHELGHARMARLFGIGTRDITISLIGGVARLERMSEKPWEEFLIALAGPAVNVVIAFLLFIVLVPFVFVMAFQHTGPVQVVEHLSSTPVVGFLLTLFIINVGLVVFNMLPAFPMDGGRVLRSVLSVFTGHLRATEIAAYVGMAIAAVLALLGILQTMVTFFPALLLIAFFIFAAGQQELAMTRRRYAMLAEQPVNVVAVDGVPPLPEIHAVEPGFSGMAWDVSRRAWVIWRNGQPVSSYGAKPE